MDIDWSTTEAECQNAPFETPPNAEDKLRWWKDTATEYGYNPYLIVATEDRTKHELKFQFIRWSDAKVVDLGPHTIDLRDTAAVWRDRPSTIHDIKKGWFGFLFLRRVGLLYPSREDYVANYAQIRAAALESGGGTGKWPKTAGSKAHLQAAIERLSGALQTREMTAADARRALEDVLAEALEAID